MTPCRYYCRSFKEESKYTLPPIWMAARLYSLALELCAHHIYKSPILSYYIISRSRSRSNSDRYNKKKHGVAGIGIERGLANNKSSSISRPSDFIYRSIEITGIAVFFFFSSSSIYKEYKIKGLMYLAIYVRTTHLSLSLLFLSAF